MTRIVIDLLDDGSVLVPDEAHRAIADWADRTGKSFQVVVADYYHDPEVLDIEKPREESTAHRAIILPPGAVTAGKS